MLMESTQMLLDREDISIMNETQLGRFQVITCEYKMDELQREVTNARMQLQLSKCN